jgi:hypothetical protein
LLSIKIRHSREKKMLYVLHRKKTQRNNLFAKPPRDN